MPLTDPKTPETAALDRALAAFKRMQQRGAGARPEASPPADATKATLQGDQSVGARRAVPPLTADR